MTTRAHGIDISKYDLTFKPDNATGQLDFVIQRISYRSTRDEKFLEFAPEVAKIPIRGGYHYLNSDTSWKTQADSFLAFVSGYDYQFYACDFEAIYNILSTTFAKAAWDWIQYVKIKTGKPVLLYTSTSLYKDYIYPSQSVFNINWNTVPLWQAEWHRTNPNPDGFPSTPTGRTNGWNVWQYNDQGNGLLYGAGRSTACDLDVFNGTIAQMRQWLNLSPIVVSDIVTYPHAGIKRITGTRYGWRFVLDTITPNQVRFDTVIPLQLSQVSAIAKNGAIKGSNCGEWNDRYSDKPYYLQPINYTVSNGKQIIPRTSAQPSLMFLNDGSVAIDHKPTANVKHAFTGLRYLVENGEINPLLDGTEGHSRKVFGINAAGELMELSTEGVYPNQGWTLPQCAEFIKQNGAINAADFGGGGDATTWADGKLLLTPENAGGLERYLPNIFLVYAGDTPMTTRYEAIAIKDGTRLRPNHNTDNTYIGSYPMNTKFHGDNLFVADVVLKNAGGAIIQQIGDVWLQVTEVNGMSVVGWVAVKNMGIAITNLTDNGAPPPPVGDTVKSFDLHIETAAKTARLTVLLNDGTSTNTDYKIA